MGVALSFLLRSVPLLPGFILALSALSGPALAHPHIWIDARIGIVFNDNGAISAVRHEWTFDQAFSSWSIQGLDTDGDGTISGPEFQALAEENMIGLREYEFYTFAGTDSENVVFSPAPGPSMSYDGARTTLNYTLVPERPIQPGARFDIEVTDPEYYAAFTFLTDRGVTLENAPENCSAQINAPKQIDPVLEQRLFELGPDITELPEDLKPAAEDLANVVVVSCGGAAAAPNAAAAAEEVSRAAPSRPFVAPPAEKGLPVVRTGFLGWVNAQQQAFYGALTRALGQLRADGNAFWTLGLLSLLYGVLHAAGPGHGKVVISSYMLASESELRRGVALSFASAMVQSVTAIVFVTIAAWILNMTSSALSAASGWLVTGSYLLIVLLGLWLITRKLLPLVRGGADHHAHTHAHDHTHHHVVPPKQTQGGWREMLGVVLAVGLRPCSGALVVLVFALSQGVYPAGIAAVFLMGLGTAATVGVLASLAVGAKGAAGLFRNGPYAALAADVIWWLELFGAVLVLFFGFILLMANI